MSQVSSERIQLQPLKRVPTLVDLENLLAWLSTCQETYLLEHSRESLKQVLLPWLQDSQQFALGITISRKLPELLPIWTFYKRLEPEPVVEWAYATPDASLIHNMLLCAFPDEAFTPESNPTYAYVPQSFHPPPAVEGQRNRSKSDKPAVLHGSLQKLQLDGLLQSLASSRISGKLMITSHDSTGAIFFEDGTPVHCQLNDDDGEGHDAMLELLSWRVGDFEVFSDEPTPKRSITRRIDSLLLESAALDDFWRFLEKSNINDQSVLERIPMSYSEYLERMKEATLDDNELVDAIAELIDGYRSIDEIAWKLGLSRAKWIPVIYSFIKADVVRVSTANHVSSTENQALIQFHADQISTHGLIDAGTSLYTSAAFLFLLQLELTRSQVHRRPFSVILLLLKQENTHPVEMRYLMDSVERIKAVTRPSDVICHFEDSNLAIILPETSKPEAKIIARRMLEQLALDRTTSVEVRKTLFIKIGGVTVPEDCNSIDELLLVALDPDHSSVLRLWQHSWT